VTGTVFEHIEGSLPVLVSMPHDGVEIPDAIAATMTATGRAVPDTDWDLHRLYDFAPRLGFHVLGPRYSRYVIDLNRAPDNRPLYAGVRNTGLVPTTSFDDRPLYQPGHEPGDDAVRDRLGTYWRPYHDRIRAILDAMIERHGIAVLFDAHTIRSRVPRFFDGRLPDFNLGFVDGTSCDPALQSRLTAALGREGDGWLVVDGRFKGGYITRHYGSPADGIHAFQLELSQATYADPEVPYRYGESKAAEVKPVLEAMLASVMDWLGEDR
jgi:N-formylglutamate amidohydrolase